MFTKCRGNKHKHKYLPCHDISDSESRLHCLSFLKPVKKWTGFGFCYLSTLFLQQSPVQNNHKQNVNDSKKIHVIPYFIYYSKQRFHPILCSIIANNSVTCLFSMAASKGFTSVCSLWQQTKVSPFCFLWQQTKVSPVCSLWQQTKVSPQFVLYDNKRKFHLSLCVPYDSKQRFYHFVFFDTKRKVSPQFVFYDSKQRFYLSVLSMKASKGLLLCVYN